MVKVTLRNLSQGSHAKVRGYCPHCGDSGTFDKTPVPDVYSHPYVLGLRSCSTHTCQGHIFFITQKDEIVQLYPPAKIRFESKNIPDEIKESFEEAISCHANENYRAAAVMIRRSIELICEHQNAKGKDLEKRIEALKTKIILAPKLFEGMHNLRMLGNDAVHIKAKTYGQIGKPEVEAGIKFAKRLIEALYQTEDLVTELDALKKK